MRFIVMIFSFIMLIGCDSKKEANIVKLKQKVKTKYREGREDGYKKGKKDAAEEFKSEKEEILQNKYNIGFNNGVHLIEKSKNKINKNLIDRTIFYIKYYQDWEDERDDIEHLTLVTNKIDTVIYLDEPKDSIAFNSSESDFLDNLVEKLNSYTYKVGFCIDEIKRVNKHCLLGVLRRYHGIKTIEYAYCKLKSTDGYYKIINLYDKIDVPGFYGEIKLIDINDLEGNEFCALHYIEGEGYREIALNYFPDNTNNRIKTLESCNFSLGGDLKRMNYDYNSDSKKIKTSVYKGEVPTKQDSIQKRKWKLKRKQTFYIPELISKMKE